VQGTDAVVTGEESSEFCPDPMEKGKEDEKDMDAVIATRNILQLVP
jgi:hypothetical protein